MRTIWLLLCGIILLSATSTPFFIPTKESVHGFEKVMISEDILAQQENHFPQKQVSVNHLLVLTIYLVIYIFFAPKKRQIPQQRKHFLLAVFYQSNNFKRLSFSF